jgi:hypothetical protein
MLNKIIRNKTIQWLQSPDCAVLELINYIKNKGELRDTQIEAIETFLFLKIKGQNKPLWELFANGFFSNGTDLSKININQKARVYLEDNIDAFSLFDFSSQKVDNNTLLPNLVKEITENPSSLDYQEIIKKLFYNVNYSDYLMSLPMGSGKTYLMGAFIYLDLYFASIEPDNKNFAHNFLVLIPSGLKTSIGPSLRTIEDFDPSWVIPEPAASNLKKILKFDVLDESKSAKQSNKARNPNAQIVNECLPNPFGQVFVVNAEKVILNKVDLSEQLELIEKDEDDEDKKANELRALIGKIPNLSILIDEVHHAAKSDIKLRQVVNRWNEKGSITTVLGFSGTPYLSSAEKIELTPNDILKISEITNTVYYYPLTKAIESFLKKPTVKIADNLNHLQIVKHGIEDFNTSYGNLIYDNGTIAKVAIYCSNIEMLENEIYPFLQSDLGINSDEILKFHGGNAKYSLPIENEYQFKSLDTSLSKIKYILLVGIGKEGWDCKSLTSVILPQKSQSASKNTIIQTACRCLRQVTKGNIETALIWLNRENATILNKQLEKEQNTSIEELNNLNKNKDIDYIERFSRMEYLQLPKIDFYQLKVKYQTIEEEEFADTKNKLIQLNKNIKNYKANYAVTTKGLDYLDDGELSFLNSAGYLSANYNNWIATISKESFNTITSSQLHEFDEELKLIFDKIIINKNNKNYFNEQFDCFQIESQIRIAFSIKRQLTTEEEIIPKEANLLIVDNLKPILNHKDLFPNEEVTKQILDFDENPLTVEEFEKERDNQMIELIKAGKTEEAIQLGNTKINPLIEQKDKSFHLLPYNFDSGFESQFLNEILKLKDFKENQLEIYFNGERGISEFVINCFAKTGNRWNKVGKYTTDFLIIKRNQKDKIHKALIIETKGSAYADDINFIKRKNFVETDFLKHNEDKFGYKKFDFLYLEDSSKMLDNIAEVNQRINQFFKD